MKEKNLLASVALFSELYNSETYKSIPDIIAEFIKGAIIYEGKNTFNSTELKVILNKVYGFTIPESVIRTTLFNKFKGNVTRVGETFTFNDSINQGFEKISEEYKTITDSQEQIVNNLYTFIEERNRRKLDERQRQEVFENFTHFLMDNGYSDTYSNHISAFVIKNEQNKDFKGTLNLIKEGVILYQGINFTADLNDLGKWNTNLTIYLSTEHLFNALGYNGVLFKEIFDDFYKLVSEINHNSKPAPAEKRRNRIELKYFSETKDEVDDFFSIAETIKKGNKALDPSKLAMSKILEGCKTVADIKVKRIKFDSELALRGIVLEDFVFDSEKHKKYNVEDPNVIETVKAISNERGKTFDEELCSHYFRIFSKVNAMRKGDSTIAFDKIGHLFVTETSFAKFLAHNMSVKFAENDIAFTKDIDFITTRFWFKLKKGFSNRQDLPKSFDVVTKARIILSSHLSNSVSDEYAKLVKQKKAGDLTEKQAIEISYVLREKNNTPEQINIDNIDVMLDFLNNEHYLQDYHREKTRNEGLLKDTQAENEDLKNQLKEIADKEELKLNEEKAKQLKLKKETYLHEGVADAKIQQWKNLRYFLIVLFMNIYLAVLPIIISTSSTEFKIWVTKFPQIIFVIIFIAIAVIEVQGRSYIFNKERLKSGWTWLKTICTRGGIYEFEENETIKLNKEFNELQK